MDDNTTTTASATRAEAAAHDRFPPASSRPFVSWLIETAGRGLS